MVLGGEWEGTDAAYQYTSVRELADFDGDGLPDVLLDLHRNGAGPEYAARIVYGAGMAGFGPRTTELGTGSESEATQYVVQDVDGNGLPDLIGGLKTILNPGGPSPVHVPALPADFPISTYDDLHWVDWTGDDRPDAYQPSAMEWWENLGGGRMSDSRIMNVPSAILTDWVEMIRLPGLPTGRGMLVHSRTPQDPKRGHLKLLVEDGGQWVEAGKVPLDGRFIQTAAPDAAGSFVAFGDWGAATRRMGVMKISLTYRNGKAKLTAKPVLKDLPIGASLIRLANLDAVEGPELLLSLGESEGWSGDQFVYYPGKGGGFVPKPVAISAASPLERMEELLDFDGDGDLDVLTTCLTPDYQGQAAWYENTGAGQSFTRRVILTRGAYLQAADAVDLNGDGKKELLMAVFTTVKNSTLYRCEITLSSAVGNAGKRKQTILMKRDVPYAFAAKLEAGDWDKDGLVDIIFWEAPFQSDKLLTTWFKGFPQMKFATPGMTLGSGGVEALYDADGDGDLDLVPNPTYVDLPTAWRENTGLSGAAPVHPLPEPVNFFSVTTAAFADLDGNGWMDYSQDGQPILAFEDGSFERLATFPMGRSWFHDLDGDGDADAVLAANGSELGSNTSMLRWLENSGGAEFVETGVIQATLTGYWDKVLSGDLDGDGIADLVAARGGELGRIEWFKGSE